MNSRQPHTIQTVENYWNHRPCNIRHSTQEIGTKDYFDEVEARKYFVESHIPRFAEFERWRGKKVLEIGCGLGTDTTNFARYGAQVVAIDVSEKSLELARQRIHVFGLDDQVQFYHGDAEHLSDIVPHQPFDLIYSFGVIHHTPNPERVLQQMVHYSQPGTIVKIMVYHTYSWKVLWILFKYGKGKFWRLADLIAENSEAQTGCPITYTYGPRQFQAILANYSLRVVDLFVDHIFPYRIPDYVQYRYVKEWYFRILPLPVFHWLERHFGWHLCVTAEVLPSSGQDSISGSSSDSSSDSSSESNPW